MSKLTKAQARMLQSVADNAVERRFDVYGGYWWVEREKRLPAYGKSEMFPPLPIRYLLEKRLIFQCANERVSSGFHRMKYAVTPAGQAYLERPRP